MKIDKKTIDAAKESLIVLSHLERIFFPGIFVITLNNFSVYSKTEHVITNLIVINNWCDFW